MTGRKPKTEKKNSCRSEEDEEESGEWWCSGKERAGREEMKM